MRFAFLQIKGLRQFGLVSEGQCAKIGLDCLNIQVGSGFREVYEFILIRHKEIFAH